MVIPISLKDIRVPYLKTRLIILGLSVVLLSASPIEGQVLPTKLHIKVLLEGPYDERTQTMNTKLADGGYLPGQKAATFFGTSTPKGHPYNQIPWNYHGSEGSAPLGAANFYPPNTVDWVLASFIDNEDATYCQAAGILMSNGHIQFASEHNCNLPSGSSYYVLIQHRNHTSTRSDILVVNDNVLSHDFTNGNGHSLKKLPDGRYGMKAGNCNQFLPSEVENKVDLIDLQEWEIYNGKNSAYFSADVDLNGDVSIKDQKLIFQNFEMER